MKRFPAEFEDLLSPRGRRVLAGRDPLCGLLADGLHFVGAGDLLEPRRAQAALRLLERSLRDLLTPLERPIPPDALRRMRRNYAEQLPKTARVRTLLMASARARGSQRAAELGLTGLLRSASFHAFAQALSGYALRPRNGTQVLCYAAGDYAGPHNDHHPEEKAARNGYVDLHLTFANAAVEHQWLVYEHGGHFSQVQSVATVGGVTCYRLPFWHYTTPLAARRGKLHDARRWVLLGTFLDAPRRSGRG